MHREFFLTDISNGKTKPAQTVQSESNKKAIKVCEITN